MSTPSRVLIAKPGLDGHDRGALLIARRLRDAGVEVIYSGLRQTPASIVDAAIAEDVDAIGLSILAGGHLGLAAKVIQCLDENNARDITVVVGGVIPFPDIKPLLAMGVAQVFPSSTPLDRVIGRMLELIGGATDESRDQIMSTHKHA